MYTYVHVQCTLYIDASILPYSILALNTSLLRSLNINAPIISKPTHLHYSFLGFTLIFIYLFGNYQKNATISTGRLFIPIHNDAC